MRDIFNLVLGYIVGQGVIVLAFKLGVIAARMAGG